MIVDEFCWERGCACRGCRDSPGVALVRKPEWVGLTRMEIATAWLTIADPIGLGGKFKESSHILEFVAAIENKLKEKNT